MSRSLCKIWSAKLLASIWLWTALEFRDVGLRGHSDEPTRQGRLDQNADLVDVANEISVDRPHARAAIAGEDDEAFAAQELQHLPNRRRRTAVTLGEVGDDEALIGLEPPRDDVVADHLVEQRRGIGGGADRVDPERRCRPGSRSPPSTLPPMPGSYVNLARTIYDPDAIDIQVRFCNRHHDRSIDQEKLQTRVEATVPVPAGTDRIGGT